MGTCHIGGVPCCTQCVDLFGGNDSVGMYCIFVHGAIVSKEARFVYGLFRPKFRVSRGLFRSPWSKGLRMGKIRDGFVAPWSKKAYMGKTQTVYGTKSAARGAWKGRRGAFFEGRKARFTKSQVRRL